MNDEKHIIQRRKQFQQDQKIKKEAILYKHIQNDISSDDSSDNT